MTHERKSSQDNDVRYVVTLSVTVKEGTTTLTAEQHKQAVSDALLRFVGGGGLTDHEPAAEIDEYSVE
jgi:hypothetical protein